MHTCTMQTSCNKNLANNCCNKEVTGYRTTSSWLLQPVSVLPTLFHSREMRTARCHGNTQFRPCGTSANQHSTPVSCTIARRACLDQQRISVLRQLLHSKNWRRFMGEGLLKHWRTASELFLKQRVRTTQNAGILAKKDHHGLLMSELIWKVWK